MPQLPPAWSGTRLGSLFLPQNMFFFSSAIFEQTASSITRSGIYDWTSGYLGMSLLMDALHKYIQTMDYTGNARVVPG